MLHEITGCPKGRRQWCGPSAIAGITGVDYMTALDTIKRVRARTQGERDHTRVLVKGVVEYEMARALERLGYRMSRSTCVPGKTFARFIAERTPEQRNSVILVVAGNHYMVVSGKKAVDNHVQSPVFTSKMKGRRRRMESAWVITRVGKVKPIVAEIKAAISKEKAERHIKLAESGRVYRRAKEIAKEIGLTIEVRGQDEIEIMAKDGHLIDDITGRLFTGRDRWKDGLEWLTYLLDNGVEQEINPDDDLES